MGACEEEKGEGWKNKSGEGGGQVLVTSWGGLLGQLSLGRALLEGWAGISGAEGISPGLYPCKGRIICHAAVGRSRVWLGRERG